MADALVEAALAAEAVAIAREMASPAARRSEEGEEATPSAAEGAPAPASASPRPQHSHGPDGKVVFAFGSSGWCVSRAQKYRRARCCGCAQGNTRAAARHLASPSREQPRFALGAYALRLRGATCRARFGASGGARYPKIHMACLGAHAGRTNVA